MQRSDPEHHHAIGGLHDVPYVAAMLACSEAKVRRLVSEGKLEAFKLGHRSMRFSDGQIEAYLDSVKIGVAS
jgi:excisionase family DNA binding protein